MCTAALYLGGTQESAGCIKAHSKKKKRKKEKLDAVTETEGQIWDPKGTITTVRITFNRHGGSAERESKVAENTLALRGQRLDK